MKKKRRGPQQKWNTAGRPLELTDDIQKKICEALEMGAYIESAAAYADVHKTSLYAWLKRGRKGETEQFVQFINAVDKAMEMGQLRHLRNIHKRGDTDWKASAWVLERKFPKKWGRREVFKIEDEETKDSSFNEESLNSVLADIIKDAEKDRYED